MLQIEHCNRIFVCLKVFYWRTSSSDLKKIGMYDFTGAVLVGGFGLGFVLPILKLEAGIPLGRKRCVTACRRLKLVNCIVQRSENTLHCMP